MKQKTGFLILLAAIVGCGLQKIDTQAEGEKLIEVSREWSRTAGSRDIEKTLSYWADDAVVISAGEPTRKGKNEIRQMIAKGYKNPDFKISWEPKKVEISESGDLGYLLEETQITVKDSTGQPLTQRFNAVTVWKKQTDGSWKNVVDVMSPQP